MKQNSGKLSVLMVIPSFFPVVGGAERQLMGLATSLSKKEIEVEIVTRKLSNLKSKERIDNYKVHRLSTMIPKLSFLVSLFFFILNNRHKYHLIHVHTLNSPAIVATIAGKILKIPVILKVTRSGKGTQLSRYRNSVFGRLAFSVLSGNSFIAITDEVNKELQSFGIDNEKIKHIPNGVYIPQKVTTNNQSLKVTYIGRLIKRKRVDMLLEAIANIKDHRDFHLTIAGGGTEELNLRSLAKELNIKDSCSFEGELPHKDVSELLDQSDIFVLPSDSEGMSNALLEAMASNNAVIVSDITANRQLINDKQNGLLFSNLKDLEKALSLILSDNRIRINLATQARITIEEGYSFEAITNIYINLYEDMCFT